MKHLITKTSLRLIPTQTFRVSKAFLVFARRHEIDFAQNEKLIKRISKISNEI